MTNRKPTSFTALRSMDWMGPDDLRGLHVTLRYVGSDRKRSERPVTMVNYKVSDAGVPSIHCMCHMRNAERSFLLDSMEAVIDDDGVTMEARELLALFKITPPPPRPAAARSAKPPPDLRLDFDLRARAEEAAAAEGITLKQLVERLLSAHLSHA